MSKLTRRFLKSFGALERPIGWIMLVASVIVFLLVLFDIVKSGDFKYGTLMIAAGLFADGFSMAQDAEENANSHAKKGKK